jgi:hypothetical protein
MTYYIEYNNLKITTFQRPDGSWAVRCKNGILFVKKGDTLTLSDKRGNPKIIMIVDAFNPHYQSGKCSRSGHIIAHTLEEI